MTGKFFWFTKLGDGRFGFHNGTDENGQSEELYDLYSSPEIIRVIESRRMRWVGYVARMGERRDAYKGFVGGDLKERGHMEDLGVYERIILKWISKKDGGMNWINLAWTGTNGGRL